MKPNSVDEYIAQFDTAAQKLLEKLRQRIRKAAPEATETMSYQMPTFRQKGNLIHFALSKNHLGVYPGPEAIEAFQEQLHEFKTSKGTIQFPLDKEIPDEIIEAIVYFNLERFKDKSSPDWKRYNQQWKEAAEIVQQVINELPLTKEFKWGGDIYTYQGKNVVGYGGFKNHFAILFYNGVFLEDKYNVLITASEGKTKALRQWRFSSSDEIEPDKIKTYIQEAIQTVIDGKEIKPEKSQTPVLAGILKKTLTQDKQLSEAFKKLTPGKQKEYILYVDEAKQEKTKLSRIDKIKSLILEGKGLHDKYKK
ncbi:DUF1801 domain-containing protein [Sphingobacterium wenxiniae]|uniref:Uncharacterized conserved protein YdeI, YjbR/CyaY-like superfamily, DUF1801 family n=1 Tax=Sphingobacterium wenxiniae TaxID=683125 RepID=A0A1I6Q462_9SPHI|nr:DUF1801 domain-containing protein [Sphingobacterium wenxiniae]SFS47223.1 Uncharacterized conserved protein YdeI, YjbR/CyaY-like superfamily, DUF1801 family [Sphingobacterium wenxiniae]